LEHFAQSQHFSFFLAKSSLVHCGICCLHTQDTTSFYTPSNLARRRAAGGKDKTLLFALGLARGPGERSCPCPQDRANGAVASQSGQDDTPIPLVLATHQEVTLGGATARALSRRPPFPHDPHCGMQALLWFNPNSPATLVELCNAIVTVCYWSVVINAGHFPSVSLWTRACVGKYGTVVCS